MPILKKSNSESHKTNVQGPSKQRKVGLDSRCPPTGMVFFVVFKRATG